MFEYTYEMLPVIQIPDNVVMIKTISDKYGKYLAAWLANGDVVQITKHKNVLTYPFQPFAYLNQQLGQGYWENFEILWDDIAINKNYVKKFVYCDSLKFPKRYDFYVYFKSGDNCKLATPNKKFFNKRILPMVEQKFGVQVEKSDEGFTIS